MSLSAYYCTTPPALSAQHKATTISKLVQLYNSLADASNAREQQLLEVLRRLVSAHSAELLEARVESTAYLERFVKHCAGTVCVFCFCCPLRPFPTVWYHRAFGIANRYLELQWAQFTLHKKMMEDRLHVELATQKQQLILKLSAKTDQVVDVYRKRLHSWMEDLQQVRPSPPTRAEPSTTLYGSPIYGVWGLSPIIAALLTPSVPLRPPPSTAYWTFQGLGLPVVEVAATLPHSACSHTPLQRSPGPSPLAPGGTLLVGELGWALCHWGRKPIKTDLVCWQAPTP